MVIINNDLNLNLVKISNYPNNISNADLNEISSLDGAEANREQLENSNLNKIQICGNTGRAANPVHEEITSTVLLNQLNASTSAFGTTTKNVDIDNEYILKCVKDLQRQNKHSNTNLSDEFTNNKFMEE